MSRGRNAEGDHASDVVTVETSEAVTDGRHSVEVVVGLDDLGRHALV
jgi:hypothetical protein